MKIQFKHPYWGDEWQDHEKSFFDEEQAAEEIASSSYHEDPCDPMNFEFDVEIKNETGAVKKFSVSAEADVNFYAREQKE